MEKKIRTGNEGVGTTGGADGNPKPALKPPAPKET
jgi:hypothetical protein